MLTDLNMALNKLLISMIMVNVARSESMDDIAHGTWNGVGAFIAVDARKVQQRLDEYAASSTTGNDNHYTKFLPVKASLVFL